MFRKQKQILLLAIMVLLGSLNAVAQEPLKLSLQDALKLAMQNNTNILNSELDLAMAKKKIWETTATGLPHADAKASYTFYPKVPVLPASFFDPNAAEGATISLMPKQNVVADITVSQLIFNGSYIVGLQAVKVYYGLTEQNKEKARLDVIETVVNTYHMLQMAEESRKILNQNLEIMDKTLYEITEMNKQGFVEKTDVDQLEVTKNTILNALNQIDSNLDMGYRLLKIQLGLEDAAKVQLADEMESENSLTTSSMQLIGEPFNIDRNIDYQLINTSEKAAKLELKLAKSGYLPTISGFYNHTEKLKAPLLDFQPKDLIGVNLSLPIFSSGERASKVAQMKMSLEKTQNTRKLVSNSLLMQASQYQNDVKLKLEKYQNQKKSKELSDDIYQRTLEKYKQGMASSMDLMTSQNQYLSNLTSYYQSIYDLQGAKSKLEKLYNINQESGNQ
ncbi:MAG: TolC family protein [Prolixibacteraceae bacterium]|nr:TolC family protein [Prolixibacteraceae bacterium]